MKTDGKKKSYLFICHGKDCLRKNAKELQKRMEHELDSDGNHQIEIIRTRCLDRCKEAPSIIAENIWYGKVGVKDLKKILNKKAVK